MLGITPQNTHSKIYKHNSKQDHNLIPLTAFRISKSNVHWRCYEDLTMITDNRVLDNVQKLSDPGSISNTLGGKWRERVRTLEKERM